MKAFVTVAMAAMIVAVASWAYAVNYDTRAVGNEVAALEADIARAQSTIEVLRVEWAFLNRPDRLRALVREHADVLGLMPADPGHFGEIARIPYPSERPSAGTAPHRPTLPMTLEEAHSFMPASLGSE